MTVFKTISTGVLATAILFGATACADNSSAPKVETKAEQTVQTEQEIKAEVAAAGTAMMKYFSDLSSLKTINQAGQSIPKGLPDDEASKLIQEAAPEAFSHFHITDDESVTNAYMYMALLIQVLFLAGEPPEMVYPVEAVTLDGDTATLNQAMLEVGSGQENTGSTEEMLPNEEFLELVKKDGKWLIEAPDVLDIAME